MAAQIEAEKTYACKFGHKQSFTASWPFRVSWSSSPAAFLYYCRPAQLGKDTHGFVGADIAQLCMEAALQVRPCFQDDSSLFVESSLTRFHPLTDSLPGYP